MNDCSGGCRQSKSELELYRFIDKIRYTITVGIGSGFRSYTAAWPSIIFGGWHAKPKPISAWAKKHQIQLAIIDVDGILYGFMSHHHRSITNKHTHTHTLAQNNWWIGTGPLWDELDYSMNGRLGREIHSDIVDNSRKKTKAKYMMIVCYLVTN